MNFDLEKFSYRLTVLLDEHNMSQTQLAKKSVLQMLLFVDILMVKEFQELMLLLR